MVGGLVILGEWSKLICVKGMGSLWSLTTSLMLATFVQTVVGDLASVSPPRSEHKILICQPHISHSSVQNV